MGTHAHITIHSLLLHLRHISCHPNEIQTALEPHITIHSLLLLFVFRWGGRQGLAHMLLMVHVVACDKARLREKKKSPFLAVPIKKV